MLGGVTTPHTNRMSVSSHIKLKKGSAKTPKSHDPYGDTYPYIREFLDKTAKKLKVEPPGSFEFEDPEFYAEMFGDDLPPDMAKKMKKQKEWHNASVGLKTFSALLEHFRAAGDSAAPPKVEPRALLYELEAFHIILEAAAKKKDSFRIEALV
jgi:hypothetical protein